MSVTAITVKDLENIRVEGLKALKERLGAVGMIKSLYRCTVTVRATTQRIEKNI